MKLHLESARASASRKILTAFLAVQMAALNFSPAWAAGNTLPKPTDITPSMSEDGKTMTITPAGQRTINYDWFDIGNGYTVNFDNPGQTTINKVNGGGVSEIFGNLNASGIIYLLNKSGVLFGDGARVNVGGLVASTFMEVGKDESGNWTFEGDFGDGDITVTANAILNAGAFAYLVGKSVNLAGQVNAGDVVVGAYGSQMDDIVLHSADGGEILLRLGGNTYTDGGDITIATDGFTNGTSVVTTGGEEPETITVDPTAITLYAAKDIQQADGMWQAGAQVAMTAGGDIALAEVKAANGLTALAATNLTLADTLTATSGNIELTAVAGDLTLAGDKAVRAGDGNIVMKNGGGMGLDGVIEGKMVTIAATNGALTFGAGSIVSGSDGVDISSKSDAISLQTVIAGADGLTVTAHGGSITQQSGGFVTVGGASTLEAENAGDIVLYNDANDFGGAVTAWTAVGSGGEIKLQSAGDLTLADVTADGKVTAKAGTNLTAGVVMSLTGDVVLTAGGVFGTAGGEDDIIRADNGGVTVESQGNLAVNKITAGSNGLTLESTTGSITGAGAIDVGGTSTLTAGGGDIVLQNGGNDFTGLVTATATGGSVTLQDANDLKLRVVEAGNGISATAGGISRRRT